MELARNLRSPSSLFPRRSLLRNNLSPSHSSSPSSVFAVYTLHDPASVAVTLPPPISISRQRPTSVLQEQHQDEPRLLSHHPGKEERMPQSMLHRKKLDSTTSCLDDGVIDDADGFLEDFEQQLLSWPILSSTSPILARNSGATGSEKLMDHPGLSDVSTLSTSKEEAAAAAAVAAVLPVADSSDPSLSLRISDSSSDMKGIVVRSSRLLERRCKKRKVSKAKITYDDTGKARRRMVEKRLKAGHDPDDPLRMFLSNPASRKLLTIEEECQLVSQMQDFNRLIELKRRFQNRYDRPPTMVQWARCAGLSCPALKSQLVSGFRSRERLIIANCRLVVFVAKRYMSMGLPLQDLLQEGSKGLMKCAQKFKLGQGTRFATFAIIYIRESINKAIYRDSRLIRIPARLHILKRKVGKLRNAYFDRKGKYPSKQELAELAGITVEKVQYVLSLDIPLISIQQPAYADPNGPTVQEVTADPNVESAEEQMMMIDLRMLLNDLSPKERLVIKLRYGIGRYQRRHSYSEIGAMVGLCPSTITEIEQRALFKLKKAWKHGLNYYGH